MLDALPRRFSNDLSRAVPAPLTAPAPGGRPAWPASLARLAPLALQLRLLAHSRAAAIAWWLILRVVVAALCVATVWGTGQLTVHLLVSVFAEIPPYTGAS
jgi:hypothetical protein